MDKSEKLPVNAGKMHLNLEIHIKFTNRHFGSNNKGIMYYCTYTEKAHPFAIRRKIIRINHLH